MQAFPNSAVVGPWVDVQSFPDYREAEFTFSIDGQERQRGALMQTMYSTDDAVAMVRDSFTLVPGDVIFTGEHWLQSHLTSSESYAHVLVESQCLSLLSLWEFILGLLSLLQELLHH